MIFQKLVEQQLGLKVEKEYRFHPVRRWRFDYFLPEIKTAIEVEGGIWTRGRHVRGTGFLQDMGKYNEASIMGFRLLRVTPNELLSNKTLELIKRINEQEKT